MQKLFPKELVYESYYQRAFCLFMTDSFTTADSTIKKLISMFPDSIYSSRFALLSVLILNHLEKISDSKKLFTETSLHNHIDTTGVGNAYAKVASVTYKSVKKTICLARYLPGAGFFYINKPDEGFVSASLNLALLGYTTYSIYTGYYITAILTGLRDFMLFHGGGVRASATKAKQYNEDVKEKTMKELDGFCLKKLVE